MAPSTSAQDWQPIETQPIETRKQIADWLHARGQEEPDMAAKLALMRAANYLQALEDGWRPVQTNIPALVGMLVLHRPCDSER